MSWLYTQRLPKKYSEWTTKSLSKLREIFLAFEMALVNACILADRFLVPGFGQLVQCLFVRYLIKDCDVYYETIVYAYDHLPADHPILEVMADSHYLHSRGAEEASGETDNCDALPHKFLVSLTLKYMEIMRGEVPFQINLADYHSHDSQTEEEACVEVMEQTINDLRILQRD